MEYITQKQLLAMNLLNLAKHHKETCNSPDCGVSLSSFRAIYEEWLGRECTEEESGYFM